MMSGQNGIVFVLSCRSYFYDKFDKILASFNDSLIAVKFRKELWWQLGLNLPPPLH